MNALAAIQAPISYGPAIELGNRVWAKRILPVGEIEYKGRTLRFTRDYIKGLERAFQDQAYDQVAFQLADSSNTHTNDPERFRGEIVDMQARDDGLWVYLNPTERGEQVLRENPNLGVSARIVEQYSRSDGKHYPAAIQHVLGTLDPRIPALGAWQPVDMANEPGIVIDLSQSTFDADADLGPQQQANLSTLLDMDPAALADLIGGDGSAELSDAELEALADSLTDDDLADAELSDEELEALMDAAAEEDEEDAELAELVDSLTDEELAGLEAQALADGYRGGDLDGQEELAEFGAQFANTYAAEQARQAQDAEPAIRRASGTSPTEDRLARAFERIAAGTYTPSYGLANQRVAVELASQAGACGPVDPVTGTCAARYHTNGCGSYESSMADGIELANGGHYGDALDRLEERLGGTATGPAFIRTEDPYGESLPVPAGVLEFAHELNGQLGLRGDDSFIPGTAGWDDLLDTGPASAMDAYAALAREVGHPELAVQLPTGEPRLDVSAIRAGLGL